MDCDLLLSWMSSLGEGSWNAFRRSIQAVAEADSDVGATSRLLRISFSDLGYADFFIAGSQTWRVLRPGIGGLPMQRATWLIWGARTGGLMNSVTAALKDYGGRLIRDEVVNRPSKVRVQGPEEAIAAIASDLGLIYCSNIATYMCQALDPITTQLESGRYESQPINWRVKSLELKSKQWVDGLLPRSACEFSPTYGRPVYFLHTRKGKLVRMGKREAVYAAAALRGVRLICYEPQTHRLSTPIETPLPEAFARAACLCSGDTAQLINNRLCYDEVPSDIASLLMVAAGQPYPDFRSAYMASR